MNKILVLFSGGLDSLLAGKILQEKGYQIAGLHFLNPFSTLSSKKVKDIVSQVTDKLHLVPLSDDYLRLIESPKHGYGKRMNPCLDCRAFLLKKAWRLAKQVAADALATGEVIGQRPFSQRKQALDLIEKETGLAGKILRPLTDLGIRGRQRTQQLALAKKYGLKKFSSPAGGCLLTDPAFSEKIKDALAHEGRLTLPLVELLKLGRHQRLAGQKVVIGRHEKENQKLAKLARQQNWWFGEVVDIPSPIAVVFRKTALEPASRLLARYSDAKTGQAVVCHWQKSSVDFEADFVKIQLLCWD